MIGKGIIRADDYIHFGKIVDELSKIAYTIMYISKTDQLIVCLHKNKIEELKSMFSDKIIEIKAPRGGLAFARLRWR